MPRVGEVFQLLSGTLAVPNTTIQSAPYNAQQQDWVLEANNARPISAGGTGATTASAARTKLGAIGAGDLAAAAIKTSVLDTDSMVIIDASDANKNKRWLVSDFRTSLATMTNQNFSLISTDASAGAGPYITLDRRSPSPATNDVLGLIQWLGRNSADEAVNYAAMYVHISDHINNQEKSTVVWRNMVDGAIRTGMTMHQTGVTVTGTMTATGGISATTGTFSSVINSSDVHAVRPTALTTGVIYFGNQSGGARYLYYDGTNYSMPGADLILGGDLKTAGSIQANGTVFSSPGATIIASSSNYVLLRPYGLRTDIPADTNQAYLRTDGYFIAPVLYATSSISTPGNISATGAINSGGAITAGTSLIGDRLYVNGGTSSYINMQDTDNGGMYIHCNSGFIGFLDKDASWGFRVGNDGAIWCAQLGDINTRIESRASAHAVAQATAYANDRVSNLQYRKAGGSTSGTAADWAAPAGAVVTGYHREGGNTGQVASLIYMYLQVYDQVRGWVGFSG